MTLESFLNWQTNTVSLPQVAPKPFTVHLRPSWQIKFPWLKPRSRVAVLLVVWLLVHGVPCLWCLGNKNGLLVPISITDAELEHIRNSIPDGVVVKRVDDRLSSLGNLIACNDHVALLHSDLGRVSIAKCKNSHRRKPKKLLRTFSVWKCSVIRSLETRWLAAIAWFQTKEDLCTPPPPSMRRKSSPRFSRSASWQARSIEDRM